MAKSSLPDFLLPFKYLSVFWWSFSALAGLEFNGLRLHCEESQLIELPSLPNVQVVLCPFVRGESVLSFYQIGWGDGDFRSSCLMLILLNVIIRLVSFALLWAQARSLAPKI